MKFIINADDLGISTEVNRSICKCIEDNVITSSTIMANGNAFEDVISMYSQFPHISFGVHLVLDEYFPITRQNVFVRKGVVNEEGSFIRSGINKSIIDNELKNAIYKEWCAQIERIQSEGIRISHMDSHHHVHTIPALYDVIRALSKKYDIRRVRLNSFLPPQIKLKTNKILQNNQTSTLSNKYIPNISERIYAYCLNTYNFYRYKRTFKTTQYFMSSMYYIKNKDLFDRLLNSNTTIELMCHPGHANYKEELALLYRYKDEINPRLSYKLL